MTYIGAETLLNGGTEAIWQKDLKEFLSDRDSGGSLIPTTDKVDGEISFPTEHHQEVIKLVADALLFPHFDPRRITVIKVITRQNMQSEHSKLETKKWTISFKANFVDIPLYHFLTLPNLAMRDDVSIEILH